MCIVAFAINQHPNYPFILIANRDEFFNRATQALNHWDSEPSIYAGKDLEAGGTWLGINAYGRWAALTNYREISSQEFTRSRGEIVSKILMDGNSLQDSLDNLASLEGNYAGYNLVAGELNDKALPTSYYSNRDKLSKQFNAGVYSFSNGNFEDRWQKTEFLRNSLSEIINEQAQQQDAESFSNTLFDLLQHSEKYTENLPKTGLPETVEEALSAPFIEPIKFKNDLYGTRSCSILLKDSDNQVHFYEQNYVEVKDAKPFETLYHLLNLA